MKMLPLLLFVTLPALADPAFTPVGFDPGFQTALIASLEPTQPGYFESCPGSPTGRCYGTLPARGGFYTLPIDPRCPVNDPHSACTDFRSSFHWRQDGADLVGEIGLDSRDAPAPATTNLYLGIQTNIPIGTSYGGLNPYDPTQTPPAFQVAAATLQWRAMVCYGDRASDAVQFGYLHYYAGFYRIGTGQLFTLAFNFGLTTNHNSAWDWLDYIKTDAQFGGTAEVDRHVYHINGSQFGLENAEGVGIDPTPDCSQSIDTQPWRTLWMPIASTIDVLRQAGEIDADTARNARLLGSIVGGLEFWGRARWTLQIKGHRLLAFGEVTPQEPPAGRLPAGKFRVTGDPTVYESDGQGGACAYLTALQADLWDVRQVTRIYTRPPTANPPPCPATDAIRATARIQQTGVYPAGRFRTRDSGGTALWVSNGVDAACRCINAFHASVQRADQIRLVYDTPPAHMRTEYCPGWERVDLTGTLK